VAGIDKLITTGRHEEAARQLETARARLGGAEIFDQAQSRLENAVGEIKERAAKVKELVASARKHIGARSFKEAVGTLRGVLELAPTHLEAKALLTEAEAGLRVQLEGLRRAQEVANTCAAIAEHLENGEFTQAESALGLAQKLYGGEVAFATLHGQLDELRVEAKVAACQSLRLEAGEHIAHGRYEQAIESLGQAESLGPGNEETARLLAEAQAGIERLEEARRRSEAIAANVAGVERLIMAGRLETAYRTLDEIVSHHGEFDTAEDLRSRVQREMSERSQRDAEARSLLEQTRELARKGKFAEAEGALRSARAVEKEHADIHDLIEEAQAELHRRVKEHRRRQDIAHAAESVDKTLSSGKIDEARRELEVAERLLGRQTLFSELRQKIDAADVAQRKAAVQSLLQKALGKQASFQEVIVTLEKALEIDPMNLKVQELLSETRSALIRYEQERLSSSVTTVMAAVDQLIVDGQLEEALKRVQAAVKELGDFREARVVRQRLSEALK